MNENIMSYSIVPFEDLRHFLLLFNIIMNNIISNF